MQYGGKQKINLDYDHKQWKIIHREGGKYETNHLKSAGAMESAGAVEIFRHSVEKFGLIYNQYLGDWWL